MNNIVNSLVEGMERLGLIASRIRKNEGKTPQIEVDIILEELRNLYMVALQIETGVSQVTINADADKAAEEKRLAEEAAAKKAAEEKRIAEEAAAKKAAEEKRLAEEAAAKKAAEEKRLAEEAAAKKAAEEKRLAEEAAAKKAAEEKRLAEEAAAKKAAEEKRLAEEAAAKKAAEEKRLVEEKARKIVEEEFRPTFAPATPEVPSEPIMDPQIDKLEGNPNDELFSDQPAGERQESLLDFFGNETSGSSVSRNAAGGVSPVAKKEVRTLADTLTKHQRNVEEQLETRVNAKKVDDLRTIININDKFSFMSELFHNNMKAYNDFILQLNAITSREEALAYVEEVAQQYKWDSNSVVVKGFYRIFERKF